MPAIFRSATTEVKNKVMSNLLAMVLSADQNIELATLTTNGLVSEEFGANINQYIRPHPLEPKAG